MKKDKKKNWFLDNKKGFVFFVIGLVVGVAVMAMMSPKPVAKLSNGDEVIVEVKGKSFTADDLFDELKGDSGITKLTELIDIYILKDKYNYEEQSKKYAEKQSKEIIETYKNYYGYTKEDFLSMNGFGSEKAFLDYLSDEFYYTEYYNEYVASILKDKEIEDYYKNNVFGEKQIYIFSSQDEKNDLELVRDYLKKGKTFKEIEKKFPKITATNVDNLKYSDTETYTEEFLKKVASTGKGKYSKVFDDTNYGHVVIYVASEKEKESLDNIKDSVVTALVTKKQKEDESLYYKAFIKLRKDYGIKFHDKKFEEEYNNSIKSYK